MKATLPIGHPQTATSATQSARTSTKAQEKAAVTFASQVEVAPQSHVPPAHVPPAQAARAAFAARADLADRPFGAIVSMFARHMELPASPEPTPAASPESDAPEDVAATPEAEVPETADAAEPALPPSPEMDEPEIADAPQPPTTAAPAEEAPEIADAAEPTPPPSPELDEPEIADAPEADPVVDQAALDADAGGDEQMGAAAS